MGYPSFLFLGALLALKLDALDASVTIKELEQAGLTGQDVVDNLKSKLLWILCLHALLRFFIANSNAAFCLDIIRHFFLHHHFPLSWPHKVKIQ